MEKEIQPTLVIGLGGTGTLAVNEVKRLANQYYIHPKLTFPLLELLAIDTEFITTSDSGAIVERSGDDADFSFEETYDVSLAPTERVLLEINKTDMAGWLKEPENVSADDFVDAQYMEDVKKAVQGMGAGGFGIVGKLALWQNLSHVITKIREALTRLNNAEYVENRLTHGYPGKYRKGQNYFNIFIITSFGGGTGKGLFLTIGVIINELLKKIDPSYGMLNNSQRFLINFMPSCFTVSGRNVGEGYISTIQANQYASYRELEHVLNYGYPLENKLKSELSVETDTCNEVFSNVINISAQKDPGGEFIGNYDTINGCVANFILTYTFGGIVNNIRAYFSSNKGAYKLGNPVREVEAPMAARNRDYGRIGRYQLSFPVDQLMRYARAHCAREILEDMLIGDLTTSQDRLKQKPSKVAEDISAEFIKMAGAIIDFPPYFSFGDVAVNCQIFDDPWTSTIQELVKGKFGAVKRFFWAPGGTATPFEENQSSFLNSELEKITDTLQTYVKDNGLLRAEMIIDELRMDLEEYLTGELSAELKTLTSTDGPANRVSFDGNASKLLTIVEKNRMAYLNQLQGYADGREERFSAASSALIEDRDAWNEKNKSIFISWGMKKEYPKSMYFAESHLKGMVAASRQVYNSLEIASRRYATLSTLTKLNHQLDNLQNNIKNNIKCLEEREEREGKTAIVGGLILFHKNKAKEVFKERRDSLELRIGFNTMPEFETFANSLELPGHGNLLKFVEGNLNRHFMSKLITESLAPPDFNEVITQETAVIDKEIRPRYSICKQLKQMPDNTVSDLFYQLKHNASLLGLLNASKMIGAGRTVGNKSEVLQIEDEELVSNFSTSLGDVKRVPSEDKENITLTIIETALPQFVYTELYSAQKKFFDVIRTNVTKGKMERHTHKAFISVEEPFGSTSQVPEEDMPDFVNFLQHIGVMRIENGYIQCKVHPHNEMNNPYEYYLDDRIQTSVPARERKLHIDVFVKDINKNNTWFTFFADLVMKRLLCIFNLENDTAINFGKEYLKRYLVLDEQTRGFPYIPDVLTSYIVMYKDQRSSHKELIRFLKEYASEHTFKAERFKKDSSEKVQLFQSTQTLEEAFDKPDWGHFTRVSERTIYHLRNGNQDIAQNVTPGEAAKKILEIDDWSSLEIWDRRMPKEYISYTEFPEIQSEINRINNESQYCDHGSSPGTSREIDRVIRDVEKDKNNGSPDATVIPPPPFSEPTFVVGSNGTKLDERQTIQEILKMVENNQSIYIWEEKKRSWMLWNEIEEIKREYDKSDMPPPPES